MGTNNNNNVIANETEMRQKVLLKYISTTPGLSSSPCEVCLIHGTDLKYPYLFKFLQKQFQYCIKIF